MTRLRWTLVTAALLISGTVQADELEGVVQVVGSSFNMSVMLAAPKEYKGPRLCPGDVAKRVRQLAGMSVKAQGSWKTDAKGEKTCFVATDFTVTKTSTGRDVVVGTLTKKNGAYTVTGDDGKALPLSELSDGLKKLDGQKVILDLRQMESPTSKERSYKVVTYAAFP